MIIHWDGSTVCISRRASSVAQTQPQWTSLSAPIDKKLHELRIASAIWVCFTAGIADDSSLCGSRRVLAKVPGYW